MQRTIYRQYYKSEHPRVIYELAWQFELPAVGGLDAYNVVISALDGRMIHRLSLFEQ